MAKVTKIKLIAIGGIVVLALIAAIFSSGKPPAQVEKNQIEEKKSDIAENLLSLKALKSYASDAGKRQKEIETAIAELRRETETFKANYDKQIAEVKETKIAPLQPNGQDTPVQKEPAPQMLLIKVNVQPTGSKKLLIGGGSYAECELTHGLYAPVQYEYSVPVVLRVVGPIQLPGGKSLNLPDARIIVRCQGDANSERVNMQAVKCATPASSVETNGYVVDEDSILGVKGKYIYNATSAVVLKSIAGASKGLSSFSQLVQAASAFAGKGASLTQLAGQGAMSGASEAVEDVATRRLAEFIPSIHVAEGRRVTFYFLSDVEVVVPEKESKNEDTSFSVFGR